MEQPFSASDVQTLVDQLQDYYVSIYGGPDEILVDPDEFTRTHGVLFAD